MSMFTKTMSLGLCVALALLVGCGRSKPPSSKPASTEALAEEDAGKSDQADAAAKPASPAAGQATPSPDASAAGGQAPTPVQVPAPGEPTFGPGRNDEPPVMTDAQRDAYWLELKKKREEKRKAEGAKAGTAHSQSR